MPLMEWNANLDVQVPKMNDEHREILRLMNLLFDKNASGASREELLSIVNALGSYTVKHFSDEEAYMASIEFPDLEKHQRIHKDLLQKFAQFKDQFTVGNGKVDQAFFGFLRLWLSAHIQGIDIKYSEHAKTRKQAS